MDNRKRKRQASTKSSRVKIKKNSASSELTMTPFTIAVSSCALFRQENGETAPGVAYPLVKALKMVNQSMSEMDPTVEEWFKIVVIPTNMDHLKKSVENYNLKIEIACEKPILEHLEEIKPILFLSTNAQNVREAISAGYGAATMFQQDYDKHSDKELRVAFDGDGVLFSDESETVTAKKGLEAFCQNERDKEDTSLALGPLSMFFKALVQLQKSYKKSPIRTYLVTSRGTTSPGIRALKTLKENNLEINEAFFLCGAHKGPVLKAINPHIFFDDQKKHVALQNRVIGAHVPYGVRNK